MSANALPEGTLTILFTDVEGSTDLGARAGDVDARRILRAHEEVVRSQIEGHGGLEIKALGDGFMIAFTSARRAVECAIAIQKALHDLESEHPEALRIRIGLNAGEVIREGNDLFGGAVAAAARISAHAGGGEILVSEVVKALVGTMPDVSFLDRGPVELKGFGEPWHLHEVRWARPEPAAMRRRTPFVGRAEERRTLRSALDGLDERAGGVVLIGGEPGVGKTRLAEETLVEARRRDYRALTGRCYESDAPPPYLPFAELLHDAVTQVDAETLRVALGDAAGEVAKILPRLRTLYDDIPQPLDIPPEQERRYLFNSIAEFIQRAAATRPLVVLLDDLQWADEASLLLLQHVANGLARMPVLVIGTYRDVELDAGRPFADTLSKLIRDRKAERIDLKRLSPETTTEMLSRLAGSAPPSPLVDAIYAESDGNAFFVEEVFNHLREEGRIFDEDGRWRTDVSVEELEVPESIRLVLGRRIERLSDVTRKTLVSAAVLGRAFDLALLEQMGDVGPDELLDGLEESEACGLIAPSIDRGAIRYRFVHELIRQTLLTGMSLPRRQRLHLKVAKALEAAASDPGADAEEIAEHLYQAGAAADPSKSVRYLKIAGERAFEGAAYEEALRYFDNAAALVEDDDHLRAEIEDGRGLVQRGLGQPDEAIATWKRALDLYERSGDRVATSVVVVNIVSLLSWGGRWDDIQEIGARGLEIAAEDDVSGRARLLSLMGFTIGFAGDYEKAMEMIEEAHRITLDLDPQAAAAVTLAKMFVHWAYAEFSDALRCAEEGASYFRSAADVWQLCNALAFGGMSAASLGDLTKAEAMTTELSPIGERIGHFGSLIMVERIKRAVGWARGQTRIKVESGAARDLELNERGRLPWRSQSYSLLGKAKLWAGDLDAAVRDVERGYEIDPPGAPWGISLGLLFEVKAHARPHEAEAMIEVVRAHLPGGWPAAIGAWELLLAFVEGLAVLEKEDDGSLHDLMVTALSKGWRWSFISGSLTVAAAAAAYLSGRWEAAEKHFADADRHAREGWISIELADVSRHRGLMLLRRAAPGDLEQARALLRDAGARYESIGFNYLADVCRRRAEERTVTPETS